MTEFERAISRYKYYLEEQNKNAILDTLIKELNTKFNTAFQEYLDDTGMYLQNMHFSFEEESLNHQIETLSELRVVFSYMTFEKNRNILMNILKGLDQNINLEKLYKWNVFEKLMSKKKIELTTIPGFTEIDEIREFSNYFKHSKLTFSMKKDDDTFFKIKEFEKYKLKEQYPLLCIKPDDIDDFYDRTKNSGYLFLDCLCDEILAKFTEG